MSYKEVQGLIMTNDKIMKKYNIDFNYKIKSKEQIVNIAQAAIYVRQKMMSSKKWSKVDKGTTVVAGVAIGAGIGVATGGAGLIAIGGGIGGAILTSGSDAILGEAVGSIGAGINKFTLRPVKWLYKKWKHTLHEHRTQAAKVIAEHALGSAPSVDEKKFAERLVDSIVASDEGACFFKLLDGKKGSTPRTVDGLIERLYKELKS